MKKDELTRLFPLVIKFDKGLYHFIPLCVYFLIHGNTVVYVGKSENLRSRLLDHRLGTASTAKKQFSEVYYLPIKLELLADTERAFIKFCKGKLNLEWQTGSRIKYRPGMEPLRYPLTEKELAILRLLILL